jgi:hypothetical protein
MGNPYITHASISILGGEVERKAVERYARPYLTTARIDLGAQIHRSADRELCP